MSTKIVIASALFAIAAVPAPAVATVLVSTAVLSGANEVAPVATGGSGSTIVTFDDVAHTLRVQIDFTGLTGVTTMSHIHCCTLPGSNTGIATSLPSFALFPLGVTSGTFDNIFDTTLASTFGAGFITASGGTVAGAETAFFNGIAGGRAYLNIHTTFARGGEIRGQLAPVPEVSTWAMMLIGFAGVGVAMRRRRVMTLGLA